MRIPPVINVFVGVGDTQKTKRKVTSIPVEGVKQELSRNRSDKCEHKKVMNLNKQREKRFLIGLDLNPLSSSSSSLSITEERRTRSSK